MHTSHFRIRIGNAGQRLQARRPGFLQKLGGAIAGIVILVGAFMLSVVVLAVVAAAGLVGGTYLWWKTRELRKQLRERTRNQPPPGGRVIDGEVIREAGPGKQP
jgi:hypothetical protein